MHRRAGEIVQDDGVSDSSPGSLAAGLDDTLDSPSIQERRGIPAGELQRDTPYSASIKSHGTVFGIVGGGGGFDLFGI